jgi:hypothetical protein
MIYNVLDYKKIQQATKLSALTRHQAGNRFFFPQNANFSLENNAELRS